MSYNYYNIIDCPKCGNTGEVIEIRHGNEYAIPCTCDKVRRSKMELVISGLYDMVKNKKFSNYKKDKPWQSALYDTVVGYANAVKMGSTDWLFIGGQAGIGKTHICTALCAWMIKKGFSVRYMCWEDEKSAFLMKSESSEQYESMLRKWKLAQVLYIDDFLYRKNSISEAELALAFKILDYRYKTKRTTIITSNHCIDDILEIDNRIGGRIIDMAKNYNKNFTDDSKKDYRLKED